MDDKTKAVSEANERLAAQERRHQLIMTVFSEMTRLGKGAAAIIQDVMLFDKYIQTGERP